MGYTPEYNETQNELEDAISAFAENIAQEIATKRFYEMDAVKALAKTRLIIALTECADIKTNIMQKKRLSLIEAKKNATGAELAKINTQISELKVVYKRGRHLHAGLNTMSEMGLLIAFLKANVSEDILNKYFSLRDKFRVEGFPEQVKMMEILEAIQTPPQSGEGSVGKKIYCSNAQ